MSNTTYGDDLVGGLSLQFLGTFMLGTEMTSSVRLVRDVGIEITEINAIRYVSDVTGLHDELILIVEVGQSFVERLNILDVDCVELDITEE